LIYYLFNTNGIYHHAGIADPCGTGGSATNNQNFRPEEPRLLPIRVSARRRATVADADLGGIFAVGEVADQYPGTASASSHSSRSLPPQSRKMAYVGSASVTGLVSSEDTPSSARRAASLHDRPPQPRTSGSARPARPDPARAAQRTSGPDHQYTVTIRAVDGTITIEPFRLVTTLLDQQQAPAAQLAAA